MEIVNQLSVFATNEPGVLANVCGYLSDQKINIQGMSIVDHIDYALVRIVVDDPSKALHLLGEAGLFIIENEIVKMELSRKPGSLERIVKVLADGKLNIAYLYASEAVEGNPMVYIQTADNKVALSLLKKNM